MFYFRYPVLVALLIYFISHGYCEPAEPDCTGLCSVSDGECQKLFWLNLALQKANTGFPDKGIPVLSPLDLKDIRVRFLGLMNITLIEGKAYGINGTNCAIPVYDIDVENMTMKVEIICQSIVIEGTYEISSDPILCSILGNPNGYGRGRIELDVVRYAYTCPITFTGAEDGEIYFEPIYSEAEWDSEVLKNATVSADNILLDDKDVTECVLSFINEYWSAVFGTPAYWFHKKSLDIFFEVWQKIYSFVPTSSYICDDLTPYL